MPQVPVFFLQGAHSPCTATEAAQAGHQRERDAGSASGCEAQSKAVALCKEALQDDELVVDFDSQVEVLIEQYDRNYVC